METCNVVLTFEFVGKILWCDHSNEICLVVHLCGTISFADLSKNDIKHLLEFLHWPLLGVKGLR